MKFPPVGSVRFRLAPCAYARKCCIGRPCVEVIRAIEPQSEVIRAVVLDYSPYLQSVFGLYLHHRRAVVRRPPVRRHHRHRQRPAVEDRRVDEGVRGPAPVRVLARPRRVELVVDLRAELPGVDVLVVPVEVERPEVAAGLAADVERPPEPRAERDGRRDRAQHAAAAAAAAARLVLVCGVCHLAVGETVGTPCTFTRCFNRDRQGVSVK